MLNAEILEHTQVEKAATIFHRDGFVLIKDALTPAQLQFAQSGSKREITRQMKRLPLEKGNRGYARYSFEQKELPLPEWSQLIDLPTILPILDQIWGSSDYICIGAGGDYSAPGAKIQHLHSDLRDFFNDPLGQISGRDVPAPYIAVNFPMVDFKVGNGATRFIPATQRSHHPIPSLQEEPQWMKTSTIAAPAGAAIIRDVRCWHGGTANKSTEIRLMLDVLYWAPWFRLPHLKQHLTRKVYKTFSARAQELCRFVVK